MDYQVTAVRTVMHGRSIRRRCVAGLAALTLLLTGSRVVHPQVVVGLRSGEAELLESAARTTLGPSTKVAQYNYIMTGRVRLLLFWKGADDVGGGYIRRSVSTSDPNVRLIQVLFGSDPAKAPRRINNWGAAAEAIAADSQAIWGFMKSTNPESADTAEAEIKKQSQQGRHAFSAIVAYNDKDRALSRSIPLFSNMDFTLHQLDQAQRLVAKHLSEDRSVRRLEPVERRCAASRGFLKAVEELVDYGLTALSATVSRATASRCYLYNARNYMLALTDARPVAREQIQVRRKNGTFLRTDYRNLVRAEFTVVNHKSERSTFQLLLGTEGVLKGVPVQILHRPNFWFEVELNLDDAAGAANTP